MISRRDFAKALAGAPLALAPLMRARAQGGPYPSRPIQLVVGFPPGQASDTVARLIAKSMSDVLKQPIFVNNKVGAAGIVAHVFVKNSPADGYTLLLSSSGPLAINPALYHKLPYDPVKDYEAVALLDTSVEFLSTARDMPVNNLREMIAYVKANPGKVSYGSSGYGTTAHIMMEMLKKATGMQMTHVPYKGSAPMVIDLMAGRVQFAFDTSSSILPQVKAGKLKTLGVSSGERDPVVPDVPTIAEQGVPGFDAAAWSGILAPAGTPAAVIEKLNAAANHALNTPEVKRHYALLGSLIDGGSADHFAQFLKKEQIKWGRAVKDSGAHMD